MIWDLEGNASFLNWSAPGLAVSLLLSIVPRVYLSVVVGSTGTTIDSCRLVGQRDVAECNITGLVGHRTSNSGTDRIPGDCTPSCAITEISNALYDVRIAERCVDERADSPWLVVASEGCKKGLWPGLA